jgi:hypothetical protein
MLAAVAIHGGVLLVARSMPPLSLLRPEDRRELRTIEIELPASLQPENREPPSPALTAEPERAPPPPDERPPEARLAARATAPAAGAVPSPTVEPRSPEQNPPPAVTGTPKGSPYDELPDDRRQGVLGAPDLPGLSRPVWEIQGVLPPGVSGAAPAPTVAPAPRPVDKDIAGKVIRDAMNTRNKDLGLDPAAAGTVASAVRVAVQDSDVPNVARGTIEFRLGPNGRVLSVRVLGMSGGTAEQWERVKAAATAALAGRTLSLPSDYAKGAIVTINVSSNLQVPAGSKGGLSGAGAAFDLSNIGAHATRHVRASPSIVAVR